MGPSVFKKWVGISKCAFKQFGRLCLTKELKGTELFTLARIWQSRRGKNPG
jgi:hypothetical protein